jgi:hypothetical protein
MKGFINTTEKFINKTNNYYTQMIRMNNKYRSHCWNCGEERTRKKYYSLIINIGWCLIGLSILTPFYLVPFYPHLLSAETFAVTYLILFEVFFFSGLCLLLYGTEKLEEEERSYRELVEVPKSWLVTYLNDKVKEEGNKK